LPIRAPRQLRSLRSVHQGEGFRAEPRPASVQQRPRHAERRHQRRGAVHVTLAPDRLRSGGPTFAHPPRSRGTMEVLRLPYCASLPRWTRIRHHEQKSKIGEAETISAGLQVSTLSAPRASQPWGACAGAAPARALRRSLLSPVIPISCRRCDCAAAQRKLINVRL
jgi:hypothetical protein